MIYLSASSLPHNCVSGTDGCSLIFLSAWFKNFKAESWWFLFRLGVVSIVWHLPCKLKVAVSLKRPFVEISSWKREFFWTHVDFVSVLGMWFWGLNGFVSLLPPLNWTRIDRIQRTDDSVHVPERQDDSFHSVQPPKVRENSLGKNLHIF